MEKGRDLRSGNLKSIYNMSSRKRVVLTPSKQTLEKNEKSNRNEYRSRYEEEKYYGMRNKEKDGRYGKSKDENDETSLNDMVEQNKDVEQGEDEETKRRRRLIQEFISKHRRRLEKGLILDYEIKKDYEEKMDYVEEESVVFKNLEKALNEMSDIEKVANVTQSETDIIEQVSDNVCVENDMNINSSMMSNIEQASNVTH